MNKVKYHVPGGKLGSLTVTLRAYQGRAAFFHGYTSIAALDREMLRRGYVRGKGGAA